MTRDQSIARGMELAAQRPEVMPDDANERIRPIYDDIQRTLRVPFVNLIFRTLANDPDYFVPAWTKLAPVLRTRGFELAADQLRAEAVPDRVLRSAGVIWEETGPLEKIRAFNDTIHYVLPKLLLLVTAWDEGKWGGGEGDASEIALGVAKGTDKAGMVSQDDAPERVRLLLNREKSAHGHPLVSSYYRILANWPDFLEAAWTPVEPELGTDEYRERKSELAKLATAAAESLPLRGSLQDAKRTDDISYLLSAFRWEFIPSMMLDVALIKAMIDGPEAARRSGFSVAT